MEELSLAEINRAVGGKLVNKKELKIDSVSTDTRTLKEGDLFIALKGENFDGHDFVAEAFNKGARAAVVSRKIDSNRPLIKVEDTTKALQDLAHYNRQQSSLPVVAVTGSTGKTTTKDMIASVLDQKYKTLKSRENFNNEIGLPLTLLRLDHTYQAVVVEMGMRGLGEIRELAAIAKPDIGVITNVGVTHIELLGSKEKIAQAKGELIESLPEDGVAVLNGDDELVRKMEQLTDGKIITYGLEENNYLQGINIESYGEEGVGFRIAEETGINFPQINLPVPGEYNVYNALAAAGVGLNLGLSAEEIKEGLSKFSLSKYRNQLITTKTGVKIINDTYNANPTSMEAALNTLTEVASGRKIAVLGDMLELGEIAEQEHKKIGELITTKEIDYLITIGELAEYIGNRAHKLGMDSNRIFSYDNNKGAIDKLLKLVTSEDTVLVKASRGMKLEEIVEALQNKE